MPEYGGVRLPADGLGDVYVNPNTVIMVLAARDDKHVTIVNSCILMFVGDKPNLLVRLSPAEASRRLWP